MSALTVDEKTNPYTLLTMALAFKKRHRLEWPAFRQRAKSDPDYYVDGVGSSVLLDDAKNTELFNRPRRHV